MEIAYYPDVPMVKNVPMVLNASKYLQESTIALVPKVITLLKTGLVKVLI